MISYEQMIIYFFREIMKHLFQNFEKILKEYLTNKNIDIAVTITQMLIWYLHEDLTQIS